MPFSTENGIGFGAFEAVARALFETGDRLWPELSNLPGGNARRPGGSKRLVGRLKQLNHSLTVVFYGDNITSCKLIRTSIMHEVLHGKGNIRGII